MKLMNLIRSMRLSNVLKNGKLTICVIGLGRIGLPTASLFAKSGSNVIGD
jgi:UDP-N-acetyl-D-mannosaminuronate dehydrogenase